VRPHETGSAAGLLNAVQQLGATLGVALLGGIFLHRAGAVPDVAAAARGVRDAFWTATGLLAATAVAAALMSRGTGDGTGAGKGSR
jgi:hypothetical protein